MYRVRWQLVYPDGSKIVEDLAGSSIRWVRTNPKPSELQIISSNAPIVRLPLWIGSSFWIPIFYRKRSMQPNDLSVADAITDLVVFGRARERDNFIDTNMYCVFKNNKVENCPHDALDTEVIKQMVLNWDRQI